MKSKLRKIAEWAKENPADATIVAAWVVAGSTPALVRQVAQRPEHLIGVNSNIRAGSYLCRVPLTHARHLEQGEWKGYNSLSSFIRTPRWSKP